MTQERKNQLYDEMLSWICEHINNDEDLFMTLHNHFGMTLDELHDNSIESLDGFFKNDTRKKAWIYTRATYESNDRETWQQDVGIDYCRRNGLERIGISGNFGNADTPRGLFESALPKIYKSKPDVIVVESARRVARNTLDLLEILQELEKNGIELHTVSEGVLNSRNLTQGIDFRIPARPLIPEDDTCTDEEIKIKRFHDALNNYICEVDFAEIYESCNSDNPELAQLSLKQMNEIFKDIYGEEPLSGSDYSFIDLPAVIRGKSGKLCLGIVCLDLSSSGEHWGTDFFTPYGVLTQGDQMSAGETKFIKDFIPYSYWYTPEIEGDIHVDFSETPDDVNAILDDCHGLDEVESQKMF